MELKEYAENVTRTESPLPCIEDEIFHYLLGMMTEVGELADVFKKSLAYGKKIDWVNVQEEVGDLMWYVQAFCNINDFNLPNILSKNIEKLRVRYPEKFTKDNALIRDLNKEREVLE